MPRFQGKDGGESGELSPLRTATGAAERFRQAGVKDRRTSLKASRGRFQSSEAPVGGLPPEPPGYGHFQVSVFGLDAAIRVVHQNMSRMYLERQSDGRTLSGIEAAQGGVFQRVGPNIQPGRWTSDPFPDSRRRTRGHKFDDNSLRNDYLARLILAAGYSGWVLLIDEVELVGRYSLLQRGRSYAELARWMGRVESDVYPGLTAVAAITDDFGLAVLQEKSDRDTIGARLRGKETDEYTTLAGRAETGMRIIEREALTLHPPDESALTDTYQRLKEIHAKAYEWSPPEIPTAATSTTRRMRSYVRRWVNEWDLKRLYPGAEVCAEEEQEIKPTYEQDDSLEQPSEPSEED